MKRHFRVIGLAAAALLVMAACSRTATPTPTTAPPVRFRIVSDSATLPLMRALTDAWSSAHPNFLITLDSGNPSTVAEQVSSGQAQLGATSLLPQNNGNAWLSDLAMDGIAIVVHAQNPVSDISLPDARAIFSGERNNWSDYGADAVGPIEVAVREDGDGTRAAFDNTVMGAQRLTLDALVMPSVETVLNFVAIKPGGIGYVPSASLAKQPSQVKPLSIGGQAPTPDNIRNGNYPLSRTLYVLSPREPQGPLRDFVAWALGPDGKQIAQTAGYATE